MIHDTDPTPPHGITRPRRPRPTVGAEVITLATFQGKVLGVDFPGWGDPNYRDHLEAPTIGAAGRITSVESHGSAPFTRYTVRFDNGTRASGLHLGRDINPHRAVSDGA